MPYYNKTVIIGHITRTPEVRYLQSGAAVCDVSLAVKDRRKQGEEWIEETSFIDVTIWGRQAEVLAEYCDKGSAILVDGRLKQETWEKDGSKHSKIKVICERMQMMSTKPKAKEDTGENAGVETPGDDIPF